MAVKTDPYFVRRSVPPDEEPTCEFAYGPTPAKLAAKTIAAGEKHHSNKTPRLPRLPSQYAILSMLGRGSMGAVYLAHHKELDRYVAIKVLQRGGGESISDHWVERFKKEARLMAKMKHQGIVEVYDSGQTADGHPYIVMEFVEGTDLQEYIFAKEKLEPAAALLIAARICDALHHAHSRGVIHRDIKPGNILINKTLSVVKIADFGIARTMAGPTADQGGFVFGTPPYMSPEAYDSGTVLDGRADVYGVGVVLYKMLTGESPANPRKMPEKIAGVPVRIAEIITRATQLNVNLRYQTAADFRKDLDAIRFTRKKKS